MGDVGEKIRAIERIDAEVLGRVQAMSPRPAVMVLPDHPTPCALRTHTAEPVPFAISESLPGSGGGGAMSYGESEAADTGLVAAARRRSRCREPGSSR